MKIRCRKIQESTLAMLASELNVVPTSNDVGLTVDLPDTMTSQACQDGGFAVFSSELDLWFVIDATGELMSSDRKRILALTNTSIMPGTTPLYRGKM